MKYLKLFAKYIWVFVGAVLFGMAAVKVKAATRGENKANDKIRELMKADINEQDIIIKKSTDKLMAAQLHSREVKRNAVKRLDKIGESSNSVSSLLSEYNANRVHNVTDIN